MKFKPEEIEESLRFLDIHCDYWERTKPYKTNEFLFDADPKGNGEGPDLKMKLYKDYAKFNGSHLTKTEKNTVFPYCDYNNIDIYVDYLADFINKYFDSIKIKFVRQ
jgi:hypothetical protein